MFSLACRDLGVDCDYVALAVSIPAVKQDIIAHSRLVHPDLMKAMNERQRAEFSRLADKKIKVLRVSGGAAVAASLGANERVRVLERRSERPLGPFDAMPPKDASSPGTSPAIPTRGSFGVSKHWSSQTSQIEEV